MDGEPMTWSWAQVADRFRYSDSPGMKALASLSEYIDARPLSSGIHGWATLDGLGITQVPIWRYDAPHLWLASNTDTVEFSYRDTNIKQRMWTRTEPADRVIERFRKTMLQLNWFTDRSLLD
jgi:hypothetical protein